MSANGSMTGNLAPSKAAKPTSRESQVVGEEVKALVDYLAVYRVEWEKIIVSNVEDAWFASAILTKPYMLIENLSALKPETNHGIEVVPTGISVDRSGRLNLDFWINVHVEDE